MDSLYAFTWSEISKQETCLVTQSHVIRSGTILTENINKAQVIYKNIVTSSFSYFSRNWFGHDIQISMKGMYPFLFHTNRLVYCDCPSCAHCGVHLCHSLSFSCSWITFWPSNSSKHIYYKYKLQTLFYRCAQRFTYGDTHSFIINYSF